jgi:hypothetical protein
MDKRTLHRVCVEGYHSIYASIRRSLPVKVTGNNPISQEELVLLAIRLRNDLVDCGDKLGSCRDFAELKNSADELVVAILEPVEFKPSGCAPNELARLYRFPTKKGSIPRSLH